MDRDLALLVLRLALAAVLLYHGLPKVMDFGGTTAFMESLNLPLPAVVAGLAVVIEVGGGVLILVGLLTELAGLVVVIEMLCAIFVVHWQNGFNFLNNGWEHPFTVLMMALALVLAGAGAYAISGRRA
jgi:putative oxidoreductase